MIIHNSQLRRVPVCYLLSISSLNPMQPAIKPPRKTRLISMEYLEMERQSLRLPPQHRDLFRGDDSMDATLCGWHYS